MDLPELVGAVFSRIEAARTAQRLRASDLFVSWDTDKDSRISAEDIRRGIARLGVRIGSDAEWAELAERLPLVTFADFRELLIRHALNRNALSYAPAHVGGGTSIQRRAVYASSQSPRSPASTAPRGPIAGSSVSIPRAPSPIANHRGGSRGAPRVVQSMFDQLQDSSSLFPRHASPSPGHRRTSPTLTAAASGAAHLDLFESPPPHFASYVGAGAGVMDSPRESSERFARAEAEAAREHSGPRARLLERHLDEQQRDAVPPHGTPDGAWRLSPVAPMPDRPEPSGTDVLADADAWARRLSSLEADVASLATHARTAEAARVDALEREVAVLRRSQSSASSRSAGGLSPLRAQAETVDRRTHHDVRALPRADGPGLSQSWDRSEAREWPAAQSRGEAEAHEWPAAQRWERSEAREWSTAQAWDRPEARAQSRDESEAREWPAVHAWGKSEVREWLVASGLGTLCHAFLRARIDGLALLKQPRAELLSALFGRQADAADFHFPEAARLDAAVATLQRRWALQPSAPSQRPIVATLQRRWALQPSAPSQRPMELATMAAERVGARSSSQVARVQHSTRPSQLRAAEAAASYASLVVSATTQEAAAALERAHRGRASARALWSPNADNRDGTGARDDGGGDGGWAGDLSASRHSGRADRGGRTDAVFSEDDYDDYDAIWASDASAGAVEGDALDVIGMLDLRLDGFHGGPTTMRAAGSYARVRILDGDDDGRRASRREPTLVVVPGSLELPVPARLARYGVLEVIVFVWAPGAGEAVAGQLRLPLADARDAKALAGVWPLRAAAARGTNGEWSGELEMSVSWRPLGAKTAAGAMLAREGRLRSISTSAPLLDRY